jgi:hypothetical protein
MRFRPVGPIAVAVGLLVLALGVTFALLRPTDWQSSAKLVLVPSPEDPKDIPGTLDGLNASGTLATYVELLSSSDLKRRAGSPPIALSVRSIPDSRVIALTAVGGRDTVQPGLEAVVRASASAKRSLNDLWALQTLEEPSGPERSGVSSTALILASALLGLLAALIVVVALRRLEPSRAAGKDPDYEELRLRAFSGSRKS